MCIGWDWLKGALSIFKLISPETQKRWSPTQLPLRSSVLSYFTLNLESCLLFLITFSSFILRNNIVKHIRICQIYIQFKQILQNVIAFLNNNFIKIFTNLWMGKKLMNCIRTIQPIDDTVPIIWVKVLKNSQVKYVKDSL